MARKKPSEVQGMGTPLPSKSPAMANVGGANSEIVEATVLDWTGRVKITIRKAGLGSRTFELDNLIVDSGKQLLAEALRTGSVLPEITWMGWGSSDTPPAAADTALGTENGRLQVTQQLQGPNPNQTVTTVYIGPNDGNGQIEELGWFAGGATATPGSGTLIARVLYSKLKDNLEAIQIDRTDTVG